MARRAAKHLVINDNRLTEAIVDKTIFDKVSNQQKMTDQVEVEIRNVSKDD